MNLPTKPTRGWFKIFARLWLEDEILIAAGESVELAFLRLLCVANLFVDNGRFSIQGKIPLEKDKIIFLARIKEECFDKLLELNRINQDEKGYYQIKNWRKYQNEYNRQKPYRKLHPKVTR